jgi:homoserine dehydrogenase
VRSTVAGVQAKHGVSVETVEQTVASGSDATATLVIGTHLARESDLASTVVALRNEDVVVEVTSVLRVVGA